MTGPDDMVGLVEAHLEMTYLDETDPADLRHFVRVSSRFYPQVEDYYDRRIAAWVEGKRSTGR